MLYFPMIHIILFWFNKSKILSAKITGIWITEYTAEVLSTSNFSGFSKINEFHKLI